MLKKHIEVQRKIWHALVESANEVGLKKDFRDSHYLYDLYIAHETWTERAYWKDIFEYLLTLLNESAVDPQTLNKVKQWTNRYFEAAIKDELIFKGNDENDKRVVVYFWTDKGKELFKIFENKITSIL